MCAVTSNTGADAYDVANTFANSCTNAGSDQHTDTFSDITSYTLSDNLADAQANWTKTSFSAKIVKSYTCPDTRTNCGPITVTITHAAAVHQVIRAWGCCNTT